MQNMIIKLMICFLCFAFGFWGWKFREKYSLAGKMILLFVLLLAIFFLFGSLVFVFHSIRRLFSYPVQFWTIISLSHIVLYTIYFISGIIFVEWLETKRGFYLALDIVLPVGITLAFFLNFAVDNRALHSTPPITGYQLQSSGYSCTAACVVNLCLDLNIPISERDVADDMHLTSTGASIAQIGYLLEKLGFNFEETTNNSIEDLKLPAILSVSFKREPNTHVVYVKAKAGHFFFIVDPAQGVATYRDIDWFKENWNGIGIQNIHINSEN